jgi:hypothetical protein
MTLEWFDAHNPHTLGGDDHMFRAFDVNRSYTIIQIGQHKFAAFVSDNRGGIAGIAFGYIDRNYKVCDPLRGPKPDCLFVGWQEAKAICEQYNAVHQ